MYGDRFKHYSKILIIRNQPLETQCCNLIFFVVSALNLDNLKCQNLHHVRTIFVQTIEIIIWIHLHFLDHIADWSPAFQLVKHIYMFYAFSTDMTEIPYNFFKDPKKKSCFLTNGK
jgi:hypothetical protein